MNPARITVEKSASHYVSQGEIGSDNPCSRQLSGSKRKIHAKCLILLLLSAAPFPTTALSKNSVAEEWAWFIRLKTRALTAL